MLRLETREGELIHSALVPLVYRAYFGRSWPLLVSWNDRIFELDLTCFGHGAKRYVEVAPDRYEVVTMATAIIPLS